MGEWKMNKEEREALISEKKAEIDRLQNEIRVLRTDRIKWLVTNEFINSVSIRNGKVCVDMRSDNWPEPWNDVNALSQKLFFIRDENLNPACWGEDAYRATRTKQKDMTDEQRKIAVEFCNEAIALYNKYVMKGNSFILNGKPYSLRKDDEQC